MPSHRFSPLFEAAARNVPPPLAQDGIVALGLDLSPETLMEGYRHGIFPWPIEGLPLPWFCPRERAVLVFDELHVPRSLARSARRSTLTFTVDRNFECVIEACAKVRRPGQPGTWITPAMVRGYRRLHELGHAHSVEAWDGSELVAGVYGVDAGGAFAGESMFHLQPDASKLALLFLIRHLQARGADWIDVQVMTPHLEALGARLVSRDAFLERLRRTRARFEAQGLSLFP